MKVGNRYMLLAQTSLAMAESTVYTVGSIASSINAIQPLDGFISYSIEFSSFPDFAGKDFHPYSDQPINDLKSKT